MIIATYNLTKYFGGIKAVDNVTVYFNKENLNLIIGPNGSGKTTFFNLLTGYYNPDRGEIIYNPNNGTKIYITNMKPEERVKLGIVRTFQIPAPFLKLTVLENLLVGYQNNPGEFLFTLIFKNKWLKHEKAAVEKAFNLLELLDLSHMWDNPADTLSGGQLKLLEIGKALMADPKVLLLDEPVGSINPVLAEKILHYIKDIKDKLKIAIIMTEHRLDIAFKYVDYVYVMVQGKIISQGKPSEVINEPKVLEAYLGEGII